MILENNTNIETFILFKIGDTTYSIPSDQVEQMEMIEEITPVPKAANFVEGVVFSRGKVIPVINLRVKFGLEKIAYNLRSRLIVVNILNRTLGLIVDTAREFIAISPDNIQPPPEEITGLNSDYISGIAMLEHRVILILNLEKLLGQNLNFS